jgi:hypothetical protein
MTLTFQYLFLLLAEMPLWQLTFQYKGKVPLNSAGYTFWWPVMEETQSGKLVSIKFVTLGGTSYLVNVKAQGVSYNEYTGRFTSRYQTRAATEST